MFGKEKTMIDRNASSRMERAAEGAQGAQAEWLGMLQTLAEQIQKQQQNSQEMTQEMMNTYMQLLNTPSSSNKRSSRRLSSGWSRPSNSGRRSSSKPNNSSRPSKR